MPSCEGQDAGRANGCLPLPRFWASVVGSLSQRARANLSSGRLDIIAFSTQTLGGAGDVRGAPLAGLVHPMAVLVAASNSRISNCVLPALMRWVVRRNGSAACRVQSGMRSRVRWSGCCIISGKVWYSESTECLVTLRGSSAHTPMAQCR